MDKRTSNGIKYTEELVNSNGSGYILYPDPERPADQIESAIREIEDSQDVVWIRVANEEDRDNLFKSEVFQLPAVRPLRWYEINDDPTLIRQARRSEMTPEEYATKWVLPFTAQVKAAREAYFGKDLDQV